MKKREYHMHTIYCDAKDTPAEVVETAIEKGYEILGFSGHGYTEFDHSYCMSHEQTDRYCREIAELKEKYRGQIKILCGIEQDYFSDDPTDRFDYVIGSVHYIRRGDKYYSLDTATDSVEIALKECFNGEYEAFAEEYYKQVGDVLRRTGGDIIGHIDMITKYKDIHGYKETPRYLNAAFDAVHSLIPYKKPFEINVGALTRGYRTTPYPSEAILKEINRCGGDIIFTGDCHDRTRLWDFFDDSIRLAKSCGFTDCLYLDEDGFHRETID